MIVFIATVLFSLALNYLLVNGYRYLINEAEEYGAILAKTINDYPMALTALSVIFPILSNVLLVLYLLFLNRWVPYARNHASTKNSKKD